MEEMLVELDSVQQSVRLCQLMSFSMGTTCSLAPGGKAPWKTNSALKSTHLALR